MRFYLSVVAMTMVVGFGRADVSSGPKVGDPAAALTVFAVTGESKEKELDFVKERKQRPTVYVFVQADKWSRPMFRYLKKLDEVVTEVNQEAGTIAIWLSEKPDEAKEYLTKIGQYFEKTPLTVFNGEKSGPKDWGINTDAHLTAVVVHKGKVVAAFAYQSLNDTDAPAVRDALKKAVDGK